jgi:two-component system nitrate/nitrite response regulator NarL
MSDARVRLVIIDDHPAFREGVALTLGTEPDMVVVGEGESADDAVRLAAELNPDILLLDLDIPGGGFSVLQAVSATAPATEVIVLTASTSEANMLSCLRAGARGYALKGVSASELAKITRAVVAGEGYVPPALAARLLAHTPDREGDAEVALDELSEREQQILAQLADGQSNRQIAQTLGLTEKTVKNNMTAIMQKLGVRNRVEAALMAKRALHR